MSYTKEFMNERLWGILPYTFHFDLIPDENQKSGLRFVPAFESIANDLMQQKLYKSKVIKRIKFSLRGGM